MPPSLSQNQIGAMNQAGQGVTAQTSNQPDWLQAMNSANLKPDQAAAVSSHSTNLLENVLSTGGAIAGGIGGAALGGLAGIESGPGAIATGYVGGVVGSGAGAAGGEALGQWLESKLGLRQGGVNGGDVAKAGAIGAGSDAILGPVAGLAAKGLSKIASPVAQTIGKGLDYLAGKTAGKTVSDMVAPDAATVATSRLASTAENMTKGEREQAILQGRMDTSGKYTPSQTEQNAGQIMAGKTSKNPVQTIKAVQDEIATRGQAAEQYLEQNPVKITNAEDASAFNAAKTSSEKYMTPAEANAYGEQTQVFQKILKSYSEDGGYNTSNYYKALKDYESQVTANLPKGKDALLVPGGSARVQAAKDVRMVVRNMIGQKNPEFQPQMYDLASLYGSLDNVVSNAEQGGASFAKRHPIITAGATTAAGVAGLDALKKLPGVGQFVP